MAWPVGSAGGSPGAREGNAIVQLPRLNEEAFKLLYSGGGVRNVAMGARREGPCHHSTPQLEALRIRTPGSRSLCISGNEVHSFYRDTFHIGARPPFVA